MNTLFFTHQHRRSTKTLRLHYGLEGMKYIIQVYEGEINGHGEKEGLPTEYQYEFEEEMLKHVHYQKNDLREIGWWETQQRFLRSHFWEVKNWNAQLIPKKVSEMIGFMNSEEIPESNEAFKNCD